MSVARDEIIPARQKYVFWRSVRQMGLASQIRDRRARDFARHSQGVPELRNKHRTPSQQPTTSPCPPKPEPKKKFIQNTHSLFTCGRVIRGVKKVRRVIKRATIHVRNLCINAHTTIQARNATQHIQHGVGACWAITQAHAEKYLKRPISHGQSQPWLHCLEEHSRKSPTAIRIALT